MEDLKARFRREFNNACNEGNSKKLEELSTQLAEYNGLPFGYAVICARENFALSCLQMRTDTLSILLEIHGDRIYPKEQVGKLFRLLCDKLCLPSLDWMWKEMRPHDVSCQDIMSGFCTACYKGQIPVDSWIIQHYYVEQGADSTNLHKAGFLHACQGGKVATAAWLRGQGRPKLSRDELCAVFPEACRSGHL